MWWQVCLPRIAEPFSFVLSSFHPLLLHLQNPPTSILTSPTPRPVQDRGIIIIFGVSARLAYAWYLPLHLQYASRRQEVTKKRRPSSPRTTSRGKPKTKTLAITFDLLLYYAVYYIWPCSWQFFPLILPFSPSIPTNPNIIFSSAWPVHARCCARYKHQQTPF